MQNTTIDQLVAKNIDNDTDPRFAGFISTALQELMRQQPNEDPWVNEIEGTKRMMVENENNYHYNIHWYCQPGIADKGEPSQEFTVYAEDLKAAEEKVSSIFPNIKFTVFKSEK